MVTESVNGQLQLSLTVQSSVLYSVCRSIGRLNLVWRDGEWMVRSKWSVGSKSSLPGVVSGSRSRSSAFLTGQPGRELQRGSALSVYYLGNQRYIHFFGCLRLHVDSAHQGWAACERERDEVLVLANSACTEYHTEPANQCTPLHQKVKVVHRAAIHF